jgi:hypothetical protein
MTNTFKIEYATYPLLPTDIQIVIHENDYSKLFLLIDAYNPYNLCGYDLYYNIYENKLLKTCYHFKYSDSIKILNTYHYIYLNNQLNTIISCNNNLCVYRVSYNDNKLNVGSDTYQIDKDKFIMADKIDRRYFKYTTNKIKVLIHDNIMFIQNLSHKIMKNKLNDQNKIINNRDILNNNHNKLYYTNSNKYVQLFNNKCIIHWYNDIIKINNRTIAQIQQYFNDLSILNMNTLKVKFHNIHFENNIATIDYLHNNDKLTKIIDYNTNDMIFYFEY